MITTADQSDATPTECWADRLLQLTVLAACLLVLSYSKVEPDLWGHVQYGLDALRDGLPRNATYSYTAANVRWINHELLSEYALALGWYWLGASALLIAKCLGAAVVLWRVRQKARQAGASPLTSQFMVVLTALNLAFFWVLRPQLFSFWFLVALLEILEHWRNHWETDAATRASRPAERRSWTWWAIPLLFALWANTHGAFLAGLAILIAFFGLRGVERLAREWWFAGDRVTAGSIQEIKWDAGLATAALFATFLNPYGARLHLWMIESLVQPRPEIVEWLPPPLSWELGSLAWLPFWTLLAMGIAAVAVSPRPKDWPRLVILGLIAWQAMEHRRHIALVALLFAYWMPGHVQELFHRCSRVWSLRRAEVASRPAGSESPAWPMTLVAGGALAFILSQLWTPLRQISVHRDLYPVAAFQYIADQGLRGKAVVSFAWAQYAIMALGGDAPESAPVQVHFDGRYDTCYPRQVVDMHFDFEQGNPHPGSRYRGRDSLPFDADLALDYQQPDLLILNRHAGHAATTLAQRASDWTLLYQDSLAQVWGRTAVFGTPGQERFIPPNRRRISDEVQRGIVAWPALPLAHRGSP